MLRLCLASRTTHRFIFGKSHCLSVASWDGSSVNHFRGFFPQNGELRVKNFQTVTLEKESRLDNTPLFKRAFSSGTSEGESSTAEKLNDIGAVGIEDQNVHTDDNVNESDRIHFDFDDGEQEIDVEEKRRQLLAASLLHVPRLGWTVDALRAGASDLELSPASIGMLPRQEGDLVQFFEKQCLEKLSESADLDSEQTAELLTHDKLTKIIRKRLEMNIPYISFWPQALSLQAQPKSACKSLELKAQLMDEIWYQSGDTSSSGEWYLKRGGLLAVYSAAELHMTQDSSLDFQDTWQFLDRRLKDGAEVKDHLQRIGDTFGKATGAFGSQVITLVQMATERRYQ